MVFHLCMRISEYEVSSRLIGLWNLEIIKNDFRTINKNNQTDDTVSSCKSLVAKDVKTKGRQREREREREREKERKKGKI